MNIFEFAAEKEKFSHDYYLELAGKTSDKGLATILNMLAEEEAKHLKIVAEMEKRVPEKVTDTDVLGDAKLVFERMRGSADKFTFDISERELYEKARLIEREARDFYLEKAQLEEDAARKEIFEQLAAEEFKHYVLMDNIAELVAKPERWLEDAEFYHLEDY